MQETPSHRQTSPGSLLLELYSSLEKYGSARTGALIMTLFNCLNSTSASAFQVKLSFLSEEVKGLLMRP
ncbi:UNVERIFIED_CONTAM: hypothetical protein Slati_0407400 [Sesamum latifolium]|uniref:Uncharacterized protein n=1 Tax=Sesamum latifolium TaxID=2727402 RepID=A0AAW2XXW7_9LAMI